MPAHMHSLRRAAPHTHMHAHTHALLQMRSPTRYTKQLWRGQNRVDYWSDAPDRTYTLRRTLRALGITKDESRVSEVEYPPVPLFSRMCACLQGSIAAQ